MIKLFYVILVNELKIGKWEFRKRGLDGGNGLLERLEFWKVYEFGGGKD